MWITSRRSRTSARGSTDSGALFGLPTPSACSTATAAPRGGSRPRDLGPGARAAEELQAREGHSCSSPTTGTLTARAPPSFWRLWGTVTSRQFRPSIDYRSQYPQNLAFCGSRDDIQTCWGSTCARLNECACYAWRENIRKAGANGGLTALILDVMRDPTALAVAVGAIRFRGDRGRAGE